MSHDDAQRYLETMRRQGYSDKDIRQSLQKAGWDKTGIDYLLSGGGAKPSVWFRGVLIVLFSGLEGLGGLIILVMSGKYGNPRTALLGVLCMGHGLFGFVTVAGLTRRWGYWCALWWAVTIIVPVGYYVWCHGQGEW